MPEQGLAGSPHRRYNPLTGEWVLVSPHRTKRPWSGAQEPPDRSVLSAYDPACYLCPGNTRAEGARNPSYTAPFVFTNDYAALLPESVLPPDASADDGLLRAEPESGICRVICYTPRHDLAMARMEPALIEQVITAWQAEYRRLGELDSISHVQIFENKGTMMGCSNPHPHGQIWATASIPTLPAVESRKQAEWMHEHDSCLLCSYLARELQEDQRVLFVNPSYVALVPFWAVWPFETMILPRRHVSSITSLTAEEKLDLARIMKRLTTRYDNLFTSSFPYSMGIHQQPTDGGGHESWHWHIHFLPPLLRSQTVKKHMVGFELLAMPQRDLTAEMAAERLRNAPETHYLEGAAP